MQQETLMTNEHFLKLIKSLGLSSDQVFEATVTSTTMYIYTDAIDTNSFYSHGDGRNPDAHT